MIDPTTRNILQDLLRREGRSFLQYAVDSFPWFTPEEQETLTALQDMVRRENDGLSRMAAYLSKNHVVPGSPGPYPLNFTTLNYVSLHHLLPILIDFQRKRVAGVASVLPRLSEEPRNQVESYLAILRSNLAALEETSQRLPGKAPALAS